VLQAEAQQLLCFSRCVRLTTYHHPVPLSRNLGNLTSWNPLGPSGPVTGLLYLFTLLEGRPGSSVGIATDYGLDGPGSNPGGDEIFRPSRLALGPTQSPVKWVPVLSQWQSAAGACC